MLDRAHDAQSCLRVVAGEDDDLDQALVPGQVVEGQEAPDEGEGHPWSQRVVEVVALVLAVLLLAVPAERRVRGIQVEERAGGDSDDEGALQNQLPGHRASLLSLRVRVLGDKGSGAGARLRRRACRPPPRRASMGA